jgi:argininosuccinate synthase
MSESTAVVAFSGGLDTSFVVPFVREQYGVETVITCTVNIGGLSDERLHMIAKRSKEVGADKHVTIDGRKEFYDQVIKYLVFGNVSRDGYPLCAQAGRLIQVSKCIELCRSEAAEFLVHGCTGMESDQFRFDVIISALGGGVKSLAPVRDLGITREKKREFLRERGIGVDDNWECSYKVSLWGNWIGGKQMQSASALLAEEDWLSKVDPDIGSGALELSFEQGEVTSVRSPWGNANEVIDILELIGHIGSKFGIGRHYHVETSIPGRKGRFAYESPAADILYEAHRSLEQVTLTELQISGKKMISEDFGRLVHGARYFDPYFDDLKAFLAHTQKRVTGDCLVYLSSGAIKAVTAKSPFDLLSAADEFDGHTGEDARGASLLYGLEQLLYRSVSEPGSNGS